MPPSDNTDSLAGKVAFITGDGSGIGRATALAFAHRAQVVIADIDQTGGKPRHGPSRTSAAKPSPSAGPTDLARIWQRTENA
jgi:NAD(P)-dependent dehydrogenase (short-subunit alcohol dehydrogenase family)